MATPMPTQNLAPGNTAPFLANQNGVNYNYLPNGNGGYNYFNNYGDPITREEYTSKTGTNYPGGSVLGTDTSPLVAQKTNAPTVDEVLAQKTKAANDSAVNSALGRLDPQQAIGNQNILNSYNSAFQQLTGNKAADLQKLSLQRTQTEGANQTARDNIGAGVRSTNQGLQRLLGSHGAGNSSASSILAPFAAAQQGNIQRSQVQDAYGNNMGALDQATTDTNTNYDNSFGQLGQQRQQKEQDLQNQIGQSRAQLLGQRSDAVDNQGAINGILDSLTKLGLNPTFTPQTAKVAAPNLAQYNYQQTAGPTTGNPGVSAAAQQAAGPYFNLIGQQKDKTGLATAGV